MDATALLFSELRGLSRFLRMAVTEFTAVRAGLQKRVAATAASGGSVKLRPQDQVELELLVGALLQDFNDQKLCVAAYLATLAPCGTDTFARDFLPGGTATSTATNVNTNILAVTAVHNVSPLGVTRSIASPKENPPNSTNSTSPLSVLRLSPPKPHRKKGGMLGNAKIM